MGVEGTRHERVGILVIAYIIGFITAYIAFGLSGANDSSLQNPVLATSKADTYLNENPDLIINEEGLYFMKDGEKHLLSLNRQSLYGNTETQDFVNGLHFDVIGATVSPDGQFVYFCEQISSEAECEPFIYDSKTNFLHPILLSDERKVIAINEHEANWVDNSTLSITSYFTSQDLERPWL